MRVIFRCDPALLDRLERPVPARAALPAWLRSMPAEAFSAVHDADVRTVKQCPPFVDAMSHGFVIPLPCDVTVAGRQVVLGLGSPAAGRRGTSALADLVPRSGPGVRYAVPPRGARDREVQQLLDDRARARPRALRHPSGQPRRPAVPPADRDGRFRPLHRCRDPVPRGLDRSRLRGRAAARDTRGAMFSRGATALDLDCRAFTEDDARRYGETAATLVGSQGTYRKSFRVKRPRSTAETSGSRSDPGAKRRDRAIARLWARSSWPGRCARTCRV